MFFEHIVDKRCCRKLNCRVMSNHQRVGEGEDDRTELPNDNGHAEQNKWFVERCVRFDTSGLVQLTVPNGDLRSLVWVSLIRSVMSASCLVHIRLQMQMPCRLRISARTVTLQDILYQQPACQYAQEARIEIVRELTKGAATKARW